MAECSLLPSSAELAELFYVEKGAVSASAVPPSIDVRTSESSQQIESVCLAAIVALALNHHCRHKSVGHFFVVEHRSNTRNIGHPCDLVYTGERWNEDEKIAYDIQTLDDRYNHYKAERYFSHLTNAHQAVIPISVVLTDLSLNLGSSGMEKAYAASFGSQPEFNHLTKKEDVNTDVNNFESSLISHEAVKLLEHESRYFNASTRRNLEVNSYRIDEWNHGSPQSLYPLQITPPASIYSSSNICGISYYNDPEISSQKAFNALQPEETFLTPTSSGQDTSLGAPNLSQNKLRWAIPRESRSKMILFFTASNAAILGWTHELESHPDVVDETDEINSRDSIFVLDTTAQSQSQSHATYAPAAALLEKHTLDSLEAITERMAKYWENETGDGRGDTGRVGWQELMNVKLADPRLWDS